MLTDLGTDVGLLISACVAAGEVADAADAIDQTISRARIALDAATQAVSGRQPPPEELARQYQNIADAVRALSHLSQTYADAANALSSAVEVAARDHLTVPGLAELAEILERRKELVTDVIAEAERRKLVKRIAAAEKALREAAGEVLDARFEQMSDTITDWWSSIRPEELVGFGGIKRRAGGALFVNLIAALRAEASSEPIEREALGVYSDSQLNALGLSIFLARTGLLDSPIVVLDDPIPGSDADHRYTFVQNTLGRLLDGGVQVILTTFDSKLAELSQSNHDWRGLVAYELTLLDAIAGTEATQTSDVFGRLLLEAEDHLHSPTPRGRRAACNSLRAAAERLAKQIIATGRTEDGHPTSVSEVDAEASILGDLVPLVSGYALENREKGQWRSFAKVLNPGNHDDDVPSTMDLKQVRGNLRRIAKDHRARRPSGLLL
jgi:hypothetical protein